MKLYSLALLLATATVAQTPTQPVCTVGATCKMVNGKVVVIALTPAPAPKPSACQPNGKGCVAIAAPKPAPALIDLSLYPNLIIGAVTYQSKVTATKNFKETVDVDSQTGRVVKLSDEEYARLQKLRQAVADEEKKIAAAHGVDITGCVPHGDTFCTKGGDLFHGGQIVPAWFPDRYEFRGQWLLINVPKVEK